MRIVSPSILAADFGNLQRDTEMLHRSAAEWIHIDVMDGLFVPNISFGFPVLKAIRAYSDKVLDVHLMIVDPERYIARFVAAGADLITFHLESTPTPLKCAEMIRQHGVKVGVSIKPATPVSALRDILPLVDMVLIMSVEPGFGGQKFLSGALDRVRELRIMVNDMRLDTLIEVDGGIGVKNAAPVYEAGADILVAGNAIFRKEDPEAAILAILNS